MRKIGVLVSGRGSNLQAILDACASGRLNARVAAVVSDVPGAPALDRARARGVPVFVAEGPMRDEKILSILRKEGVDLVLLAGYMRKVGKDLVREFRGRMMNIHPSLLPAFPGLDAQRQALEYGVKVSGCTVHFVDEGLDTGPIILQKACPVVEGDTVEALSERILSLEHSAYIEAIDLYLKGRLSIKGRVVHIGTGEL